jgi:hypothetical protein
MPKPKVCENILNHPDKEEIINKMLSGISIADINEWLKFKYVSVSEEKFVLSEKVLTSFKKDYLDIYSIIKEDLSKSKSNLSAPEELREEIQGSQKYHKILEKYANAEVDIKQTVKKCVVAIETRASQVFDQIQEDPRNFRNDNILIEWFNTLTGVLEKYDQILNGNPEQINIQNNINIQIVDKHINVVYNIIKEILTKLDYDTSLLFIDMFNDAMKNLKSDDNMISLENRLNEAKIMSEKIENKIAL